ncbi:uncharacterized protein TRAVEDRAFT_43282 [Trametes versicolor FP-101664 SS1]|uniref:uncharacterized protein n=1 Tax=Trametes versicolor (strain FP-101664) TaxID=717944 RepID=UPI0004623E22|nr:uncharacterized protein TRAVEDRAFT_43282 [Trametes versicolor FP-101664 SS1]EIW62973.1 hypothetical protein TRAVEDRAFT_43282 [Trametes versicolor FP-101664 SS1]
MYTTRNPSPVPTFPPFEPSRLGTSEGGLITLHVAFPESPIFQLSLLVLAMSLLITTTAIKQYIRAKRTSKRTLRAADDETKKALDQAAKNLAKFEASRRTPLPIEEDSLPPPTRSPSDASHHSRKHANPKIHQTLKRTKTFSAQILTTGTRPLLNAQRAVVNQCTIMGRGVLHPMRTMRHHADEPTIPELPTTGEVSSPDQSSTESESERSSEDSSAADDTDSTPPSSNVSLPSEEKDVKSPVARARTFPFSRTLAMTFSIPSTPDRANRTPTAKGGVRRTANKDGEPIRYARPARPENSISGVVYETRFESPVKTLFRTKPKGKAGNGSAKKTNGKQGFGFMKSSPSLRRLFFSSSSEGEDSQSDSGFWSRRSSLSSEATGATSVRSSISEEAKNTTVPDASGTFSAMPGCVNA